MLNLTPDHPIMQHKAKVDDARERAASEAREARGRRAAQYMANEPQGDDVSPMNAPCVREVVRCSTFLYFSCGRDRTMTWDIHRNVGQLF